MHGAKERKTTASPSQNESENSADKYPQWHNLIAGGVAGAGSRLFTAPLDLLKIRRQLQPNLAVASSHARNERNMGVFSSLYHIMKSEGGLKALFRGNVAATYLWIGYAAIQFSTYSRTSIFLTHLGTSSTENYNYATLDSAGSTVFTDPISVGRKFVQNIGSNPTTVAFVSGATAGVAATLATYPFDVCRTVFAAEGVAKAQSQSISSPLEKSVGAASSQAMQSLSQYGPNAATSGLGKIQPPKTIVEFAKVMFERNGLRGFFAGVSSAVVQIVPYMGLNFAIYDYLTRLDDRHDVKLSGAAGFIAGGFSKLVVHPLDTVKKRLQAQTFISPSLVVTRSMESAATVPSNLKYNGMIDCIIKIGKEEGVIAFYRGLTPTLLKSMVGTGVSFAFFTLSKNILEEIHDKKSQVII